MSIQEVPAIVSRLREAFDSGITRPIAWRKKQLQQLKKLLKENEDALCEALNKDLGKSPFESWSSELNFVKNEINHTLAHLGEWMRAEQVPTPAAFHPASSEVRREPLGVVLVIAPWNYPIQLALGPMAPALAAGNCVLLKPSEVSPSCSAVLAELVPRYLDTSAVQVVEGGVPETSALLEQRFDHIFFTGSGPIGKIVMAAAAKHLTPVTLELGGKSPCIVDRKVSLEVSARRILWGKFFNTGQTCIAPDYVLVHRDKHDALLAAFERAIQRFFQGKPQESKDYGRIVSERHFDRLLALLQGQTVVTGGGSDRAERYIEPTILRDVDPESPVMQEEIFGPILPVIPYDSLDEAIAFVNGRDKPLALYLFSRDSRTREAVLQRTSSGGVCINQTLLHLAVPDLPFGGVGPSGMGAYHGRAGFETFSHRKSIMARSTAIDPWLLYPPFTDSKQKITRRLV